MTNYQCGVRGKAVGLTFLSLVSFVLASPTNAEVKVSAPTTTINLREFSLGRVLKELGDKFEDGYLKKENDSNKLHLNGQVTLGVEQNSSGEKQPVIYLRESGMSIDKLYFSQIEMVKSAVKIDDGNVSNHLLISYVPPTEQSFLEKGRMFYDFLVKEEGDAVASYFLSLAQCYNRNQSSGNCPLTEAPTESQAGVYLSGKELDAICSGNASTSTDKYDIQFLGEVKYDDCAYNPEESTGGLEIVLNNIQSMKRGGVLVFCGDADRRSTRHCHPPANEGNFLLSFYRAKELAEQAYEKGGEAVKETTQIPYPKGTALNQRSTRVYHVLIKPEE